MRCLPLVIGMFGAVVAFTSSASAQLINLTGTYRCIQNCRDGYMGAPAFVTQNGWNLNLVTETGESYRAWPDLAAPYGRIWIEDASPIGIKRLSALLLRQDAEEVSREIGRRISPWPL